jgi:SAM-dependent methyltransferase
VINEKLANKIKIRWEKCPTAGSHLYPTRWHVSEENMMNRFKTFLKDIDLYNKVIIDYGCGGGYLGRYLFENWNIKKYIAFDIAERSVGRTNEQLEEYKNKKVILLEKNHNMDFVKYKPDIFCSFACIIHFPTQIYLNTFLKNVNNCKAMYLVLEIRNTNKGTVFWKKPYKNFKAGNRACITEPDYISKHLTNYFLYKKTDHNKHKTNCQILYYKCLKKGDK